MPDLPAKPIIFAGEFLHSFDDKHRITIPAAWRRGEGDPFFVVPHESDQFLMALPPLAFEGARDIIINNQALLPEERQSYIDRFYAKARECALDRQGRLVLPEEQCRRVGLQQEVMLVGNYNKFQIWNPANYGVSDEHGAAVAKKVSGKVVL